MSPARNDLLGDRKKKSMKAEAPVRRRLAPEERSQMILDHAIAFFAERGFDGQLKDLAEIAGVSQALIFAYYGSKQVLIERVYEKVYIGRWKDSWHEMLVDRTKPLDERLREYYADYLKAIDEPIWIRIVLHSGLSGNELTRRYVSGRVEKILRTIVSEVYDTFKFSKKDFPEADLYEIVWDLQASFLYGLVRKHIWNLPVMQDSERLIEQRVRHFMSGLNARGVARRHNKAR
ncbi:TetR/AcrR family transcriptional regulator [Bradyrhizobium septentrionale]|uniref:TetR/AcrR family transcriptional regulator n=1 Tax=Bradyrhizobium septentrionale TaxID=1404411 RepID=A0ABZ2NXS2_9BRAD